MRSFDITEMKRDQMLLAALILLLVAASQFFVMKKIQISFTELAGAAQEAQALKTSVEARSDAVIQFKSTVKIDDKKLPVQIESQNKFYAVLLNLLAVQGFNMADVTKSGEQDGVVTFKVAGEAQYTRLLYLLASFRQSGYLLKVNDLTLDGLLENNVKYTFTISAKIGSTAEGEGK